MGVTGLWTVVQPCARPIKLETLNRKRLAVDASIWIYQFLKAVRDKEGNALRNSHVVGFFRRICKLLFFGIKPVFVFDGGAPALKRQTITGRRARREGRRDDAVRTAGKLLAVQMQRRAEEEERRLREDRNRPVAGREEEPLPEDLVYVDELGMSEQEKRRNRTFKKTDAYHLPDLDVGLSEMGAPNDPRIMSQEELEEYARHFHSGEDINVYDFSKIDFNSPFFQSLPAADRYNILNAARLRSRLRMGYSKEQLDSMFPDRMAFSKFQIERVKERNELTQRLMNLNGMNGAEFVNGTQRVAGERGKEYVLVKNEGVEGGWALGVVSNKNEGERSQPIDVEGLSSVPKPGDEGWEDEDEFEDVPIEGMNRLPKQPMGRNHNELATIQSEEARKARQAIYNQRKVEIATEAKVDEPEEDPDSLFLSTEPHEAKADELFEDDGVTETSDNEDLQRAIAMSLEKDDERDPERAAQLASAMNGWRPDQAPDFNRKNAQAGRAFAQIVNNTAQASQVRSSGGNAFTNSTARRLSPTPQEKLAASTQTRPNNGFSGPLPFESLNLGGSFLRRKKKPEEEGGFQQEEEKEKPQALPPWFSGDVREGAEAQKAMELEAERQRQQEQQDEEDFGMPVLRTEHVEVVDLDPSQSQQVKEVVELVSSDDDSDVEMGDSRPVQQPSVSTPDVMMDDVAEVVRALPPVPDSPREQREPVTDPAYQAVETQAEQPPTAAKEPSPVVDDVVEWSDSDMEAQEATRKDVPAEPLAKEVESSPEPDFEDVDICAAEPIATPSAQQEEPAMPEDSMERIPTPSLPDLIDDEFSDPEDEELMRQMAAEAEEHARFAASLNAASSAAVSAEAYERELRQLRGQQARDRRDADEVTQVMVGECQQLLRLFGLPYITAPMEAEAQCAELVRLELVDGIVTDDSDIFLFGGTRVYKNMFNQARFVECYLSSDLESEYSLTRNKVIQIAHLLGSDYTEGLPGIGPVTALEILSEFDDLSSFKEWWTDVQSTLDRPAPEPSGFRKKFRKNATKLFLPPSFPDPRVDDAYLHPDVDHDTTPFQWGVPDLDALRAFLMQTVGWGRERADEILVPVVRDMNRRAAEGTQSNITRFFSGTVGAGAGRMRGLQGDHGSKSSKTATDADAAAEAGEPGAVRTDEGFAPRRRAAGGSKRMETALTKLSARARRGRSGAQEQDEAAQQEAGARKRKSDDEHEADEAPEPPRKARKSGGSKAKAKNTR